MKPFHLPILAASLTIHAHAGDGVLDLTQLANYANQPVPNYITRNNTTAGNSTTDRGATLGRVLFHDKRLSRNNTLNNGVITQIGGGTDLTNTRSPSLRDLLAPGGQPHSPSMHDGSFTTVAQVINHYNAIPGNNANLDPRHQRPGNQVQNLNFNQAQKDALAAFLATLKGSNVYSDAKWSDPFDAQNQLTLIVLPPEAVEIIDHGDGAATIACQAAPNLKYNLQSSNDLSSGPMWKH